MHLRVVKLSLALLLVSPLFPNAQAQELTPSQILVSGLEEEAIEFGERGGDYFGFSVAISGKTLVVGTPFCGNCDLSHPGKVLIYERDDELEEWVLQQTLTKPTESESGISFLGFGKSVAIADDIISLYVTEAETRMGYHMLFSLHDSEWVFTQAIAQAPRTGRFDLPESILDYDDTAYYWGFTEEGDYAFANTRTFLDVFKKNAEGIYIHQERLQDATFSFGSQLSAYGTTLAVLGSEIFGDDDYIWQLNQAARLYSIETGTLVLLSSVDSGTGAYESVDTIVMASEGLLVMSIDFGDGYYGIRYTTFGDPANIITSTRPPDLVRDIAVSDETIAVGGIPYNGPSIGLVQVIGRRERQLSSPTAAPTDPAFSSRVRKFVLFATDKDTRIASLEDGDVFDRKEIGRALNIRAATDGPLDSVVFELNGVEYSTGERFPYMLRNGNPSDFRRVPELASGGTFTVTATPYSGPKGTGTPGISASVTFVVT